MEKNNAAEEAFKTAIAAEEAFKTAIGKIPVEDHLLKAMIADMQADDTLKGVIQTMHAIEKRDVRDQEDRESFDNLKGKEYNTKSDEPKTSGGFATLCVLGAAALAVAVPYLINKFKKED